MKRMLSIIFVCSLLLTLVAGCAQDEVVTEPTAAPAPTEALAEPDPESELAAEGESLNIVSTIFPQYDWVREILGDKAENMDLTLLISTAVDLHSFQPSVSDIVAMSTADLFIYVGGASDDWVEDVLRHSTNPDMITIDLMEVLGDGAKLDEIIEGMQHDRDDCELDDEDDCDDDSHDHGHSRDHDHDDDDHDDDHDHSHDHHDEFDEHVWLSLRNAVIFCHAIAEALSTLDPVNADVYAANLAAYTEKLMALDAEYTAALQNLENRTLLFADRFPFRYLVDDYDLSYYAAFTGCSAETEASFSTIIFLAGKVDELGLDVVMVTESGNRAIAETVISNTESGDQRILELDSMQSVTAIDVQNGVTFLSIMESNLNVLREALR